MCSIMRNYPSVTIRSFRSSYRDGGLTFQQMECMFDSCIKDKNQEYRIIGAFHGIEVGEKKSVPKNQLPAGVDKAEHFVFGDPNDYAHLSQEEREDLTRKMMANHEIFAGNSKFGGSKNVG